LLKLRGVEAGSGERPLDHSLFDDGKAAYLLGSRNLMQGVHTDILPGRE